MHVKPMKRRLLDSQEVLPSSLRRKRTRKGYIDLHIPGSPESPPHIRDDQICARLVTTNEAGRTEAALISIDKPVTIGRSATQCTYVISDPVVSNVHFKVFAVRSSSGSILLTCTDSSTNGIKLNEHLIKKASVILSHGDIIRIPSSQTFKCNYTGHVRRSEKKTLFDPTPPLVPADRTLGKYRVTSCALGSGSFATVYLAYTISNSAVTSSYTQVACKMLKMSSEKEKCKLMREVELLKGMDHPNINHILDVVVKEGFLPGERLSKHRLPPQIRDLSTGGDLFSYISRLCPIATPTWVQELTGSVEILLTIAFSRRLGRMNEGESRYCGFQLMLALQYLHERSVSHRDLKPENVLLHSPGPFPRLIIADFGLARPRAHEQTLNAVGTISYMPPEAILAYMNPNVGYVGIYADAWGLGVILYTMLCGYHPFDSDPLTQHESNHPPHIDTVPSNNPTQAAVMSRIVENGVSFENILWKDIPYARDLVGRLLVHSPKHRETVNGALASEWILIEIDDLKEGYRERVGPCP